jgi:hypothetical protein
VLERSSPGKQKPGVASDRLEVARAAEAAVKRKARKQKAPVVTIEVAPGVRETFVPNSAEISETSAQSVPHMEGAEVVRGGLIGYEPPGTAMSEVVSSAMPSWALPAAEVADVAPGVNDVTLILKPGQSAYLVPAAEPPVEAVQAVEAVLPVSPEDSPEVSPDVSPTRVLKPRTEKRRAYFAEYMRVRRAEKKDQGG